MKKNVFALLMVFFFPVLAHATVKTETVEYKHGDQILEGYLAYDDANGKRPGVLVVHEWMGLNEYAKKRARQLAELGYVAFAADIYGKGIRPANQKEAGEQASIYKKDRNLMRERAKAGLEVLKKQDVTDDSKLAAIGYCFGGTTVLELARSGADVQGVVSFHGGLDTPKPEDAKNIKGKVLALHGADDPFVTAKEVQAFEREMREAKVDWQLVSYGGAVHAFTNPDAGKDVSKGAAYDEKADKRSWEAMQAFLREALT
jgi:dienelactone hydrolase